MLLLLLRPRALEYLCGVVTDLYVDLHKLNRGVDDVRHDMPKLQRLVLDYQPKALLDFFAPNLASANPAASTGGLGLMLSSTK